MVSGVGYKQTWGEVAPARLVAPKRRSSSCPRLETILEEGVERHAVVSKKVFLFLPLILSTAFCFLLYNDVTPCV